jgi:Ran GTPase-activating protein (RanGAP) involved in mRNA processing and transport
MIAIGNDTKLKYVDLSGNKIGLVEHEHLEKAVTKRMVLKLSQTHLTPRQVQAIFTGLCKKTEMVEIALNDSDLSPIEPAKFAKAITKLTTTSIGGTNITFQQAKALMGIVNNKSTKIKQLHITYTNRLEIEPHMSKDEFDEFEEELEKLSGDPPRWNTFKGCWQVYGTTQISYLS